METELIRVWQLVSELSEQLARNQELATSLKNQALVLKVSAGSWLVKKLWRTHVTGTYRTGMLQLSAAQIQR